MSFDEQTKQIDLTAYNPHEETRQTGYEITVDRWLYAQPHFNISAGETYQESFNVTDGLDVESVVHTVNLTTFGAAAKFTFDQEYNTLHPGAVPVPRITDIEVDTGTARGNESTVVYVTVENPSKTGYVSHAVAYTEETSASSSMANPLPGTSETVMLELLEPVGSDVRGEIRLFMGKPNETEGALEQVEFSGAAGSETEYEREAYEPFRLDGPNGGYSYGGSGGDDIPDGVPLLVAGVLGVVLLGGAWWWRR
ncbi:hypothetical protein [Salarchaeum japonicum]|uniref:hypothetical protein n=1 Tax=Salarchaeum japonicum TaxID=555573 RepID=UPI001D0BBB0A|nr:hypothetical protein [Salarchaeum japonicum]